MVYCRLSFVAVPSIFIMVFFLLLTADVKKSSANELNDIKNEFREFKDGVTLNIGPSPKNLNFVGISKDYFLDRNTAVFGTIGYDNMYLGAGVIYYTNGFRNDGLVFSSAIGFLPDITAHATAGYQLKIERKHYGTAGLGVRTTAGTSVDATFVLAYEYKF